VIKNQESIQNAMGATSLSVRRPPMGRFSKILCRPAGMTSPILKIFVEKGLWIVHILKVCVGYNEVNNRQSVFCRRNKGLA